MQYRIFFDAFRLNNGRSDRRPYTGRYFMLKRIIVDCLICSALVAGGKFISNVAEKNPKLKVVKDNIKKTGKDFSVNCKEVGKSILNAMKKEEVTVCESQTL